MKRVLWALVLFAGCKPHTAGALDAGTALDAAPAPVDAGAPATTMTIAWTIDQSKAQPPMTGAHANPDPTSHSVPISYIVTIAGTARKKQQFYANGAAPAFDPTCSQVTFLNPSKNEYWEIASKTNTQATVSSIDGSAETGEHRTTFETFDLPAVPTIRQDVDVIAPDGTHSSLTCTGTVAAQRALTPSPAAAAGECTTVAFDDTVITVEGHPLKASGMDVTSGTVHYPALDLKVPLCGQDGKPVKRVQLMSTDDAVSKSLDSFVKKPHVSVEGTVFPAQTAHHHEPILIDVKKIVAK